MSKKKSITRISDKKRGRPKIRFNIWGLFLIFLLTFGGCFALYMITANFNDNFLEEEFDNTVTDKKDKVKAVEKSTDASVPDSSEASEENVLRVTNPVAESEPKDASYLSSCCLVTDSTLLEMGNYTDLKDIIGSAELTAAGCNTIEISSNYGKDNVYELLKNKKISRIYIMLGSDIGVNSVDTMISAYTEFVKNLRGYFAEAEIYLMQLPPVRDDAQTAVGNNTINEFNTKLLTLANTNNVYCIDTNTALKDVDGMLAEKFIDPSTGLFTEAAYKTIADYILSHTV